MNFFVWVSTLIFLLFIGIDLVCSFESYVQEMALYDTIDDTGNYMYFRSNVPDTTAIQHALKNVKRVCFRGRWDAYSSANYENKSDIFDSRARTCLNQSFEHKSFRHMAAGNTSHSAISLYAGKDFTGHEYFVSGDVTDGQAQGQGQNETETEMENGGLAQYGGIEGHIGSMALTGELGDSWQLFEGTHFNGSSSCARKNDAVLINSYNERDFPRLFNLTTVGSVKRNCSANSIPRPSPTV